MIWFIFGFVIGLIVGWNFLEQPIVMKDYIDKILGRKNQPTNPVPSDPSSPQTEGTTPTVEAEPDEHGRRF